MIKPALDDSQWEQLGTWCTSAAEKCHKETKDTQIQKFTRLIKDKSSKLPKERIIRNLSSRTLTTTEEEVLALGLNFAPTTPPGPCPEDDLLH